MQGRFTVYTILFAAFICSTGEIKAQDESFMYGRVTTIDGEKFEGAIRWGKEEVYWTDMFNAAKAHNEFLDFLTHEEREELENRRKDRWDFSSTLVNVNWNPEDREGDFVHQFVCQFGEIKSIKPTGREKADVTLQSGGILEVKGPGYNDIGTVVKVLDHELGVIELSWSRIDEVQFMPAPKKLDGKFGEPLYGTVECSAGKFSGYIQWDHDERVSKDKLDGSTEDGKVSIDFGNLASIEKYGSTKSVAILKSGRELILQGSNDVNSENRGIIVTVAGLGRIDIPWKEFDKVVFTDVPGTGSDYQAFSKQEKLTATVESVDGDQYQGNLIFDLDEAYNYEVLQGKMDGVEFIIPFRNIKTITPKNYNHSEVTLRNAGSLILQESQDVSDKNQGLVILKDNNPVYVRYEDVQRITF